MRWLTSVSRGAVSGRPGRGTIDPVETIPLIESTTLEGRIEELEAEIRARDEFLAIAAHELRNPMTPIAAWIELLSNLARREAQRIPPEIVNGLARLETLVEAYVRRATIFLDISRINSRNIQLDRTEVNLSELLQLQIAATAPAAASAGSALSAAIEDGVTAMLDRTAVGQVVENLLSNAVRYGAGQPIHVRLAACERAIELSVADNGIGIAVGDRDRIFEQFHRAAPRASAGGFGIGLWIARQLVLAMGGEIAVTGELGRGSTFTVTLPKEPKTL